VIASGPSFRVLPRLDEWNEFFWTSGADGRLRFLRCGGCHRLVHPPSPICPYCLDRELTPEAVSGRGTVHSYTLNVHPWIPGSDPYLVGLVTIAEQDDVRLTTNLVGFEEGQVRVGLEVQIEFEQNQDVWLPLFRLADGGPSSEGESGS
jgi:uncharacterized protein